MSQEGRWSGLSLRIDVALGGGIFRRGRRRWDLEHAQQTAHVFVDLRTARGARAGDCRTEQSCHETAAAAAAAASLR